VPPDVLTFSVSDVTGGAFQLGSNGDSVSSFTAAQLAVIKFVDDGDEVAPSYKTSVSDGYHTSPVAPVAATIIYTPVNDNAPVLAVNALTITEGATVTLGTGNFAATDSDVPSVVLIFMVSDVTGGSFQPAGGGNPLTTFTQLEIQSSAIQFVHDGNEAAPTFKTAVFDGIATTTPATAAITYTPVNDNDPVFDSSSMPSVPENTQMVLTVTATDADRPLQTLRYSIVPGVGDAARFDITSLGGVLKFKAPFPDFEAPTDSDSHNDYEVYVTVRDEALEPFRTATQHITVTVAPVNEFTPVLTANALTITEGGTVLLTATNVVAATDADLPSDTLTFTVSLVTGGAFRLVADDSVVTTFTVAQVAAGAVQFVHDSGESAPSFSTVVSDGTHSTMAAAAVINYTPVNDHSPVFTTTNSVQVVENTTTVLSVVATDHDLPPQTITYSVVGGADLLFFDITSGGGELFFRVAPDYEEPKDDGGNNIYLVQVMAEDGANPNLTTIQLISVTVIDRIGFAASSSRMATTDATPQYCADAGGTYDEFTATCDCSAFGEGQVLNDDTVTPACVPGIDELNCTGSGGAWMGGLCNCIALGIGYAWDGAACSIVATEGSVCIEDLGVWSDDDCDCAPNRQWDSVYWSCLPTDEASCPDDAFWDGAACDCSSFGPHYLWTGTGCAADSAWANCGATGGIYYGYFGLCDCGGYTWDTTVSICPSAAEAVCAFIGGTWDDPTSSCTEPQ